jgi:hypothetical protein
MKKGKQDTKEPSAHEAEPIAELPAEYDGKPVTSRDLDFYQIGINVVSNLLADCGIAVQLPNKQRLQVPVPSQLLTSVGGIALDALVGVVDRDVAQDDSSRTLSDEFAQSVVMVIRMKTAQARANTPSGPGANNSPSGLVTSATEADVKTESKLVSLGNRLRRKS